MGKSSKELYNGNEGWEEFPHTNNWVEALRLAKEKHRGQKRDEGTPYFEHIKRTVEILIKEANTVEDEILTVAALHDILEDTDCTYEDLEKRFGKRIADCVLLLTRKKGQTFEEYAREIFQSQEFKYARKIKLADRLHNLRTLIKTENEEKIERKIKETEKYIIIYDKQSPKILMDKVKEQVALLKKMEVSKKHTKKDAVLEEHD